MKNYLKGFLKGFLIVLLCALFLVILEEFKISIDSIAVIMNLLTCFYIFAVNKKNKQPNGWILLSLLIGVVSLPFYFGAVAISTKNKSNINKTSVPN